MIVALPMCHTSPSSSALMSESSPKLIRHLNTADVVLGRGAGPNEHVGNVAFRHIVDEMRPSYMAAANRKMKSQIADKVVKAVKAKRGRFLKRASGYDDDIFVLAEDEVVVEKAKQALRYDGSSKVYRGKRRGSFDRTRSSSSKSTPVTDEATSPIFSMNNLIMERTTGASPSLQQIDLLSLLTASRMGSNNNNNNNNAVSSGLNNQEACNPQALPGVGVPARSNIQPFDWAGYELILKVLMTLAEEKSRSSSNECLQILNLVESLVNTRREQEKLSCTPPPIPQTINNTAFEVPISTIFIPQLGFYTNQNEIASSPDFGSNPEVTGVGANILNSLMQLSLPKHAA
jgi:hypothetical protein